MDSTKLLKEMESLSTTSSRDSKSYKVVTTPNVGRYLPEQINAEIADALSSLAKELAIDPLAIGKRPACPPFPPFGYLTEQKVRLEDGTCFVRVFFEVDLEVRTVAITGIGVQYT